MANLSDAIKERKIERMRMGQASCDFVTLLSDPEIRIAIVPLTEAELEQSIEAAAIIQMGAGENQLSLEYRERVQMREILFRAIRDDSDLTQKGFKSPSEMSQLLDAADINHIWDSYLEMVDKSSPSIDGIPPEEFENLKIILQTINWSDLSGRQWYAAKRFLSSLSPTLLLDKSPGSGSTKSSTMKSESETHASSVERSNQSDVASLVESH